MGNVPTIEGVTCFSTDVDTSSYKLERGRLTPNITPGFGIRFTAKDIIINSNKERGCTSICE